MRRVRYGLVVAVAAAALVVLPANVFASTGFSQGATVTITGAHQFAGVGVAVDVAVTCQPLNGVSQLSPSVGVSITERVKKTVAQGTAYVYLPNSGTITCDGITISHFEIDVLPSGSVPFTRGVAAMDASANLVDPNNFCCTSESADTGLNAVTIGR